MLRGEKVGSLNGHINRVSCLGVSNDGISLCTGSWDSLVSHLQKRAVEMTRPWKLGGVLTFALRSAQDLGVVEKATSSSERRPGVPRVCLSPRGLRLFNTGPTVSDSGCSPSTSLLLFQEKECKMRNFLSGFFRLRWYDDFPWRE